MIFEKSKDNEFTGSNYRVYMKQSAIIIIFFAAVISLSSCSNKNSTDLSNITFDGIRLGHEFKEINIDNYTLSDRYPEKDNTVSFEEWQITADESGVITRIHANANDIDISINSNSESKNINDVSQILGNNYTSRWYDREQKLKQNIYVDSNNHIKMIFIYNNSDSKLVWVITEKD